MPAIRIMHYMNQFFAGVGGEEKADVPVSSIKAAVGPGRRLQALLGDEVEIVVTVYCGDNYFSANHDEALASILEIARYQDVEIVVAGPAFNSGRYGFACAEVCHQLSTSLGLNCVTSMYPENPGVAAYKQYKDNKVFVFPTTENVAGMEDALSKMARCVSKLAAGSAVGSPFEEGYIPRGFRVDAIAGESGGARAVSMLLDMLSGHPFTTEIPIISIEKIPVAHQVASLADARLALVTSSGVSPLGNPDGFKGYQNKKWVKYSIDRLNSMQDADWDAVHGGYNTEFMKRNPNYGVPLDALRELEKEGVIGGIYPYFYATSGCGGLVSDMSRIGKEMFLDMQAEGVDAALLVST